MQTEAVQEVLGVTNLMAE
jgi:hypothetical protein